MTFNSHFDGEQIGFIIMGIDYAYLRIRRENGKLYISQVICKDADKNGKEISIENIELKSNTFYLQININKDGFCNFYYKLDESFHKIGNEFKAKEGKWIGAKIGYVALREGFINDAGNVDIDWIRFTK